MASTFILNKIKEHLPSMAENIDIAHLNNSGNLQHYLALLACQIPNMPFDRLHQMCEKQEKAVLCKIQEIKEVDIFEEIALINPSLNLKNLSMEEVSKKISRLKPEPVNTIDLEDQSEDQDMEQELHFDVRSRRSDYDRRHQLKNIFQEDDHPQNWWNENKLFEFN